MGLREKQALERRQRVLAAAHELICRSGSVGLSMRALARRAELSVQTVYNLFGSKGGVLHGLRLGIIETLYNQAEQSRPLDPLDYLLHLAEVGAATFAADPVVLRILMKALKGSNLGANESSLTAGSVKMFQRPIEEAIEAGLLRADADAEFVARHLVIGFLGVLDLWVREVLDDDGLRTHLLYIFTLMLLGVSTGAGRARLLGRYHRLQRELPRVIREVDAPLPLAGLARGAANAPAARKRAGGAILRNSRSARLTV